MSIFKVTNQRVQSTILSMVGLSLLLCNTWLPLPITIEKDLSIPFPCQFKGCGCQNADQCWDNCCCHSDSEKLAWSIEHDVEPPSWFMERIKDLDLARPNTKTKPRACSCCCKKKTSPPPVDQKNTRHQLLILKQQMSCNGISKTDHFQQLKIQLYPCDPSFVLIPQDVASLHVKYDMRLSVVPSIIDPRPD